MRFFRLWTCFALALLTTLSGCPSPVTELIVVVDTDFAIPSELDAIRVVVTRPDATMADQRQMLTDRSTLPLTLGVVAEGSSLGPIDVVATGQLAGATVVTRSARATLVRNETRVLVLHLSRSCAGVTCPSSQTCTESGCQPIVVADLPPWTGHAPRLGEDAGLRDAGLRDAGPFDAGNVDANLPDANFPDAYYPDVGMCTSDGQCDDGIACTQDSCASGRCQHAPNDALCDDGNPCTDGTCGPSGCVQTNNTAPCDDATFCNGVDVCAGGTCTHPGDPCVPPTHCDETADACRGCTSRAQCPADVTGSFTSCDYVDGCDQSAMQQRVDLTYACVSGDCIATPMTVTNACSRSTDGLTCGTGSCGGFGTCNFPDTCAQTGQMTQTCTDLLCGGGSCRAVDHTNTASCNRTTEGNGCGATSCTAFGACDYTDVCDQDATQTRTCTDPVCRSSSCGGNVRTESQTCSRSTDGLACGPSARCAGGSCVACTPSLTGAFSPASGYLKGVTGSGASLDLLEGGSSTSYAITASGTAITFTGAFTAPIAIWQIHASGNQLTFVDWNGSPTGTITVSGATVSGDHAPPCDPVPPYGCFPPTVSSITTSGSTMTVHDSSGGASTFTFACP